MDATMNNRSFLSAESDLVAGLPHAPLAMPKQMLERAPRGLMARLLGWITPGTTRAEG